MTLIVHSAFIRDANGVPVQIVPLGNEGGVETAFTGTAARLTLPAGIRAFMFTAIGGNCRLKFGGSTVTATDASGSILFPAGSAILIIPVDLPGYVSVIGVGSDTGIFQAWPMSI